MLKFSLAICLSLPNLPWFLDLTFQVPMQYCSLQHQTLISPPETFRAGLFFSTLGHTFHSFWATSLLFSSSILATYCPVDFIFQFHTFLSFHIVHGVLKTRMLKWFAIPFSSGQHFVRTPHHPSWVALHGMPHSFTELDKTVIHVISLVFWDCGLHSVCPLMDEDKSLWKLPGGRYWPWWKLCLALMGKVMFSKSLIQFSADGWA